MSMFKHDPRADYVILLWCRMCGHLATRPFAPSETVTEIQRRVTCGKCRSRDVGVRHSYEPKLSDGLGLHIWELRMIAQACTDAANHARDECLALSGPHNSSQERDLLMLVAVYERLSGCYLNEARQREALPMHVLPPS